VENQIVISMGSVLTIIGGFGLIFGWFYRLLSKKFDAVDKKFEKLDGDIKDVKSQLNAFEKNTEHRLTVLEMEAKSTNQRLTDFQGQVNQRLSTIEGYLVPKKVFHFEERHEEESPKEN